MNFSQTITYEEFKNKLDRYFVILSMSCFRKKIYNLISMDITIYVLPKTAIGPQWHRRLIGEDMLLTLYRTVIYLYKN